MSGGLPPASLISTPTWTPRPVPVMSETGVISPSHSQAGTRGWNRYRNVGTTFPYREPGARSVDGERDPEARAAGPGGRSGRRSP